MVCKRCGTVFCLDGENDAFWLSAQPRLYCSKVCGKKSRPSHHRQKRSLNRNPRAVRSQITALRQRDGDRCWLCLLPIDFTITDSADPMRCSRDHVIPRSLGGGRDLANLRLAHAQCNAGRGLQDAGQLAGRTFSGS